MRKFTNLGYSKANIRSIGITNQRETTLVWDKNTGEPFVQRGGMAGYKNSQARPGAQGPRQGRESEGSLRSALSTYPSSVKLLWLIQNIDAVKQAHDEVVSPLARWTRG